MQARDETTWPGWAEALAAAGPARRDVTYSTPHGWR